MLEQHQENNQYYCTPLKPRLSSHHDDEEETTCEKGRTSITKTYSVPSTNGSPGLRPNELGLYEDLDLSQVLFEEEEIDERCPEFYERGYCLRGEACQDSHREWEGWVGPRKYDLISNFPELAVLSGPRRTKSFLQ